MIELTYDRAVELLDEIVAEKGSDFVYTKRKTAYADTACLYVYEGRCDCLIGHLLHRVGVSLEDLTARESEPVARVLQLFIGAGKVAADLDARRLLASVQSLQDAGVPWGMAVAEAQIRVVPRG